MRNGHTRRFSVARGLGAVAVVVASCADTSPVVRPDDMSAAEHHAAAQREGAEAHRDEALVDPNSPARDRDYLYTVPVSTPTEGPLADAEKHRQHARQHERAAEFLEQFEEVECRQFSPRTRAACPLLGPVVRIDDIEGGVSVLFKPGTPIDAVLAHMRCHYAFARARAFDQSASCPLYLRGIEIRRALNPMAIEILSSDPNVARDVRRRAREEAVFVRQDPPPR
jgi:hypothetical protein